MAGVQPKKVVGAIIFQQVGQVPLHQQITASLLVFLVFFPAIFRRGNPFFVAIESKDFRRRLLCCLLFMGAKFCFRLYLPFSKILIASWWMEISQFKITACL